MAEWKERAKALWKKQKFGRDSFLIMILGGLLLLIIAWPTEKRKTGNQEAQQYFSRQSGVTNSVNTYTGTDAGYESGTELEAYASRMELSLEEMLEAMDGVGEARVMITYASDYELVPLQEVTQSSLGTQEADASGGTRIVQEQNMTQQTVYTTDDAGNQVPYVITMKQPEIIGVAVCARGGGDPAIQTNITQVIQSLFRIEANRIIVTKMKS